MRFCTGVGGRLPHGACGAALCLGSGVGRPVRGVGGLRFVWGASGAALSGGLCGVRLRTVPVGESGRGRPCAALFGGDGVCSLCGSLGRGAFWGGALCGPLAALFWGGGCGALWGPSVAQCFVWRKRCAAPGSGGHGGKVGLGHSWCGARPSVYSATSPLVRLRVLMLR